MRSRLDHECVDESGSRVESSEGRNRRVMSNEDVHDHKRWYDQDPVLARALEQLRLAPDKYQAQVALNIMKILIEHEIEEVTQRPVEELDSALNVRQGDAGKPAYRRWYDLHETLRSAMQMLQDCPDDLQKHIIPSIANMIEQTLTSI